MACPCVRSPPKAAQDCVTKASGLKENQGVRPLFRGRPGNTDPTGDRG